MSEETKLSDMKMETGTDLDSLFNLSKTTQPLFSIKKSTDSSNTEKTITSSKPPFNFQRNNKTDLSEIGSSKNRSNSHNDFEEPFLESLQEPMRFTLFLGQK